MSSPADDSLIPRVCPFTGEVWGYWTKQEEAQAAEQRELVRQACVAEYSSNPLYQARAAKDPDYWKSFSVGQHNYYPRKADLPPPSDAAPTP
ncbi:MAG: hypothetical protein HYU74_03150 [Dechloromonas sp.]|nr:hypothetical protein [Dechloromonas sp.]